jgi:AraC-like DNA-binding protein
MTRHIGSGHPQAKLDESDVVHIKALLSEREYHRKQAAALTFESIADKFGVHEGTVRRISRGLNWTHV